MNSLEVFQKLDKPFDFHTEVEHDIWLYPYYIKYLIEKNDEDFTGDEIYVWQSYVQGSCDWMPLEETRYLNLVRIHFFNLEKKICKKNYLFVLQKEDAKEEESGDEEEYENANPSLPTLLKVRNLEEQLGKVNSTIDALSLKMNEIHQKLLPNETVADPVVV